MRKLTYHLVDVFTDQQFGGNQLAVFADDAGLSDEMMQVIARELNLSETVFVTPSDHPACAYRLRIFTPKRELPLAGHPTVGAGYVLAREGMIPKSGQAVFEEGVGPISVTMLEDGLRVVMEQPIPTFGTDYSARRDELAAMLSLPVDALRDDVPVQVISAGVPFLYIPVVDRAALARVRLRLDLWAQFWGDDAPVDIFTLTTDTVNAESVVHSRMFAPTMDITEDPATGAASGPLGAYLLHYGLVTPEQALDMQAEQGFEMGRPSLIGLHIEADSAGTISRSAISGYTQPVGGGYISLA